MWLSDVNPFQQSVFFLEGGRSEEKKRGGGCVTPIKTKKDVSSLLTRDKKKNKREKKKKHSPKKREALLRRADKIEKKTKVPPASPRVNMSQGKHEQQHHQRSDAEDDSHAILKRVDENLIKIDLIEEFRQSEDVIYWFLQSPKRSQIRVVMMNQIFMLLKEKYGTPGKSKYCFSTEMLEYFQLLASPTFDQVSEQDCVFFMALRYCPPFLKWLEQLSSRSDWLGERQRLPYSPLSKRVLSKKQFDSQSSSSSQKVKSKTSKQLLLTGGGVERSDVLATEFDQNRMILPYKTHSSSSTFHSHENLQFAPDDMKKFIEQHSFKIFNRPWLISFIENTLKKNCEAYIQSNIRFLGGNDSSLDGNGRKFAAHQILASPLTDVTNSFKIFVNEMRLEYINVVGVPTPSKDELHLFTKILLDQVEETIRQRSATTSFDENVASEKNDFDGEYMNNDDESENPRNRKKKRARSSIDDDNVPEEEIKQKTLSKKQKKVKKQKVNEQ